MRIFCGMRKQKIHCVVIDRDVEATASLDAALRSSDVLLELKQVASTQQLIPVLQELRPHLLFCPRETGVATNAMELLETLQHYSPDTLLIWISRDDWQGLTTWLNGVESCTLPLNDLEYFGQYIDFLLRYSAIKHDFRHCKHLLGVAELRCHWLVDYSWEAIAYISQGMHLYANNAYVTLFGFEGLAEVRSMPVAQLVDPAERKTFEAMGKAADVGSKPSNRLLITLRTLDGERLRAEIRFIPAVLKGKRCTQLHVRPLERNVGKGVPLWKDNPWETSEERIQQAPAPRASPATRTPLARQQGQAAPSVPPQPIAGMTMAFHKLQALQDRLPAVYVAEPEFQQKANRKLGYSALVQQLGSSDSRFRLDYWNLGQVVLKLSSQGHEKPGYLVFVSVGGSILNNESQLKRVIDLLNAAPAVTPRIVVALPYQDCIAHLGQLGKVITLLRGVGARFAIDGLPAKTQILKFVQVVKPVMVRLLPDAVTVAQAKDSSGLQQLVQQLADSRCKVIIPGTADRSALQAAYATAA